MTKHLYSILCFCLLWANIAAQTTHDHFFNGCGSDEVHRQHPEFKAAQEKLDQSAYEAAMQGPVARRGTQALRTLPVVVHIIHNDGPENISDAQVLQGMAHLNASFNATFGTGVNTDIQFCLAQRDPDGKATNGITRTKSALTVLDKDLQDLEMKNLSRWKPTCYINIWLVGDIKGGVIGYAYLPGAHGSAVDGIVMEASYFGSSQANSGVTVHEMGHYLGLYHTFQGGCKNDNCLLNGDQVCDTPPDQTTFASCNPNANSCNTDADDTTINNPFTTDVPDLGEDYMDYSSLSCFSKFTQGQSERMNFFISGVRSSLTGCLSCQTPCPAPVAANITFPTGPVTISVGSTQNFVANALNTNTYSWNVGSDPSFSNALSASYNFNQPGTFWVKFSAVSNDPGRCPDALDSILVTVLCPTVAIFSVPPVIKTGQAVTFSNTSMVATDYEWLVNNSSVANTTDLTYTFNDVGGYVVCLKAKSNLCENELCLPIFVENADSTGGNCDNTFVQSLSNMGGNLPGIFPHPNGDFFATGLRNDSIVLVRFASGGTPIWARAFKFGNNTMQVRNMFVDDSGDLIGVAHVQAATVNDFRSAAFRYNLGTNNFTWIKIFPNVQYSHIHSIGTDSSFCVLTGTSTGGATQLTRISKLNGNLSGYNLTSAQGDFFSLLDNNTLYGACRRYITSNGDFRVGVFAHNALTGAFQWENTLISRGNASGATETRMYPETPIKDGNNLLVVASGDLSGFEVFNTGSVELVVAKTDLAGNVIWTKQYEHSGFDRPVAQAIVATNDGYYVVSNLYLPNIVALGYSSVIKIDKDGNVIWAKRLGISGKNIVRNIMERNGYLHLMISSDSYASNDLLLVKLDRDGNTSKECDFIQPIQVTAEPLGNIQDKRNNTVNTVSPSVTNFQTTPRLTGFTQKAYCITSCACPVFELSAGADSSVCKGSPVQLNATVAMDTYDWSPATGLDNPKIQNPVATPAQTTTYTLTATRKGVELINNGDFSKGNVGFMSQYPTGTTGFGTYNVTTNPTLFNGLWKIPLDHSPSADNLMMMIDGSVQSPVRYFWRQTVQVEPNTDYRFELWGAMAFPASPPRIEFKVNGTVKGVFNLIGGDPVVGVWQPFMVEFNSGNTSQLDLVLSDLVLISGGNDFAVDDLSLRKICTYSADVTVGIRVDSSKTLELGPDVESCLNAVYTFDAGPGFKTYRWQDGSTDQIFTAFGPGKYWVEVSDDCGSVLSDTVRVSLSTAPTLQATADTTICRGSKVQLGYTSNGVFSTHNWSPTTGLSCTTCPNPIAQPLITTTYYIAASTSDGCTNLDSVTIWVNQPSSSTINVTRCNGESYLFDGKTYSTSGTYSGIFKNAKGCDSLVTLQLTIIPPITRSESISFCSGKSVVIGGKTYNTSGTVTDTRPGANGACDTVVTYTLTVLPLLTKSQSLSFCSGKSVIIGGKTYTSAGTVMDTLPGIGGSCDTVATYTLTVLPIINRAQTLLFCPGGSVTIAGKTYTQPGTVIENRNGTNGACDTIITYNLTYQTPAPSVVSIKCPNTFSVAVNPGGVAIANYPLPTASTDCPCPGVALSLTKGFAPGSTFLPGNTEVCYEATDSCGNSNSCCFTVFVREAGACDIKEIGCMKYELLGITADSAQNLTYRIRVTNKCPNKLIYTAIQLPDGIVAMNPKEQSVFSAEITDRKYEVRNPNFTPFYSIRFKSTTDSIANGQSEILRYTLPAQAVPKYMQITSRLATQEFYPAHLNTFYCPIGITPKGGFRPEERTNLAERSPESILLFPNPTSGILFADMSAWTGQQVQMGILNAQGQMVQSMDHQIVDGSLMTVTLPAYMPNGLYTFVATNAQGAKVAIRFVLAR